MLAAGTVVAGRYRVSSVLGRGGMGVVYRVEHVHTGEELALKLLLGAARFDPQSVTRFKREARAAARIRSEHVVRVTDADAAPDLDGTPFIVMELLHGSDLEHIVAKQGALPPALVVTILSQAAQALELAHRLGIVHRDLKPENLFLHETANGTTVAKVLDFGISKFVAGEGMIETGNMTSTGSVLGTPLYMAPEQAHGHNDKIAPTTDVWAMGLVALRLLTGENYWGAPTMADLMMKLVVNRMIAPSERWPKRPFMSAELDSWFLKSCNRDQSLRWQSIEQQMAYLAKALDVPALPLATPQPAESYPRSFTSLLPEDDVALAVTAPSEPVPSDGAGGAVVQITADEGKQERVSSNAPVTRGSVAAGALDGNTEDEQLALSRSRAIGGPSRTTRVMAVGALVLAALGGVVWAIVAPPWARSVPVAQPQPTVTSNVGPLPPSDVIAPATVTAPTESAAFPNDAAVSTSSAASALAVTSGSARSSVVPPSPQPKTGSVARPRGSAAPPTSVSSGQTPNLRFDPTAP